MLEQAFEDSREGGCWSCDQTQNICFSSGGGIAGSVAGGKLGYDAGENLYDYLFGQ